MDTSIFNHVYPCSSVRYFISFLCSSGEEDSGVSAYILILSRYLPPNNCQHGTLYALPQISQRAISTAHTPPACLACPPNCFIFLNINSTLQGFSPSILLFNINAYRTSAASLTSPNPYTPWFVSIRMMAVPPITAVRQ